MNEIESLTPRTDAAARADRNNLAVGNEITSAEFSRTLERDLAERTRESNDRNDKLNLTLELAEQWQSEANRLEEQNRVLREALEELFMEYDDRKSQWGTEYLWEKHEDVAAVDKARAALSQTPEQTPTLI